ncbi:MAG: chemotaxis-specific protein-glutamate methyltransferase CheB [Deltaproteobacteria bacterium]|nr:chemotaxis-specific protein-glutamate methyltransferase CheB [Deltaproteobacteria bacterium]
MTEKINVLVVNGSVLYRHFYTEALNGITSVGVSSVAANGKIALARLTQTPMDVVLFDLETDERDTIEFMKTIRTNYPDLGLVPLCGLETAKADMAVRTLEMGAIDILTKPDPHAANSLAEFRTRLEPILRAFSGRKHVRLARRLADTRSTKPSAPRIQSPLPSTEAKNIVTKPWTGPPVVDPSLRIDVVVIGVSTGGPNALAEVIPKLPKDLGLPILLVQHMPPLFTGAMAENLNKKSAIEVHEAIQGEEVVPNKVYIAPGGKHMTVANHANGVNNVIRIILTDDPPVNSCRPALDVLFQSVALVYPGRILATIMTGMGNDGMEGVRMMKVKGCYCLSQTEETCAVYGMPRAVDEAGLSDEQVPLNQIARRIETLVRRKAL